MHCCRFMPFDKVGPVAVAVEKLRELFIVETAQNGGIGDLVAVEMQNGKHRSVARRIEKFVRMPARGEGTAFALTVAHNAAGQQVGIVVRSAVGMHQSVAELSALVDGPGGIGRSVAGDPTWERELLEQFPQAFLVLLNGGVKL